MALYFFCFSDLHIPNHLHDQLAELPPAPDNKVITFGDLSQSNKQIHGEIYGPDKKTYKSRKLVASLEDKVNYVGNTYYFITDGCILP